MFTHDPTLFSVFIPGLKKPGLLRLDVLFGERLFKALLWESFPQAQIERMLDACRIIRFTRSNNRSVLGSMNDIRFQIGVQVAQTGGLANVELADLHQRLNRTPFSAIAYRHPVEGLRDLLAH